MSESSDRPFGHHTLKLRAVFVPEGAQDQVSGGDVMHEVGHNAAKVAAVFVPDGGSGPGRPFVHVGRCVFRPDASERGQSAGTDEGQDQDQDQDETDSADAQEAEPAAAPLPPVPALARGDRSGAGEAIRRSMADPVTIWRRTAATAAVATHSRAVLQPPPASATAVPDAVTPPTESAHAPSAASDPPPDAPQSD